MTRLYVTYCATGCPIGLDTYRRMNGRFSYALFFHHMWENRHKPTRK